MVALERLTRDDLTDPEATVVEHAVTSTWCEFGSSHPCGNDDRGHGEKWGPERTIRAQLLYELLAGSDQLPLNDSRRGQAQRPGAVRIKGARITGRLDLEGVEMRYPLHLDCCYLDCEVPVLLRDAHAPTIRLTNCHLPFGLDAYQLRTTGDLNLYGVNLYGYHAVSADANSALRLIRAHIGGTLYLSRGRFCNPNPDRDPDPNPDRFAVNAHGLRVDGDLLCKEQFEADGGMWLAGAHIGGLVNLSGGKFRNPNGLAINADRVRVDWGLFCNRGFEADGEVRLRGAQVSGVLDLSRGKFRNPNGFAVNALGLRLDGGGIWQPDEVLGVVNLAFAHATVWSDHAVGRRAQTLLHGFQYEVLYPGPKPTASLAPPGPETRSMVLRTLQSASRPGADEVAPRERIEWLNQDPNGYSPQPYAQLAAIYRSEGHDAAARTILVASQKRRRQSRRGWRSWPSQAWGRLLLVTVGYGYRPWLALLWLLALVTIGTLVIRCRPDAELVRIAGAPPRNALLYTVDVLLPFVDLGYGKWVAHGWVLRITAVLVVLGWVLATAVVAAFAGVLRRGD